MHCRDINQVRRIRRDDDRRRSHRTRRRTYQLAAEGFGEDCLRARLNLAVRLFDSLLDLIGKRN
jgi:hypothetical protein